MKNSLPLRLARNTLLAVGCLVAVSLLSQDANAQCRNSYGGYHGGHGGGNFSANYNAYRGNYGYNSGISLSINRGYSPYNRHTQFYAPTNHYQYRAPRWHDTSHYDYHPGITVRHGNHYDYIPGHYDFHRTGHWHH